ncbi:TPA: hypothetical protein QCV77_006546 [Bacillus thuringiensis]|nr:hypothetical protein [Bacillus thuringiensis]
MRNSKGDINKRRKRDNSTLLLISGLAIMYGTKATGNVYIGGFGVIIGLAIFCAVVTGMIGEAIRKRKNSK